MASADEDRFRLRPGALKARSGAKPKAFVSQVLKAVSQSGAKATGALGVRPASTFGRGRVAAGSLDHSLGASARRVVIKSRFVVLRLAPRQQFEDAERERAEGAKEYGCYGPVHVG